MQIPGRCHCGNIALRFTWPEELAQIAARVCTCSFA